MSQRYVRVGVGGVLIYTSLEDMARCLEELDEVLAQGTAEGADVDCVFKALNYLKKYRSRNAEVISIINAVEAILKDDIEKGVVKLW